MSGHEPWCDDRHNRRTPDSHRCTVYAGSVAHDGVVVSTSAEVRGQDVVVLVERSTVSNRVVLQLSPTDAISVGKALVRLGEEFTHGRRPRRRQAEVGVTR